MESMENGLEKYPQTHLSFVLFFVDLILFWFGLEWSMDKDQKCVKKHVGILRDLLSNFFQNPCFCFGHILA